MISNIVLSRIIVLPNPVDVILPNNYTYSVLISNFPDTLSTFVNIATFDNLLIDLSSTEYTMDQDALIPFVNTPTFDNRLINLSSTEYTMDQTQ
jgi:hypothetical protein